jgi:hypothetical protein
VQRPPKEEVEEEEPEEEDSESVVVEYKDEVPKINGHTQHRLQRSHVVDAIAPF